MKSCRLTVLPKGVTITVGQTRPRPDPHRLFPERLYVTFKSNAAPSTTHRESYSEGKQKLSTTSAAGATFSRVLIPESIYNIHIYILYSPFGAHVPVYVPCTGICTSIYILQYMIATKQNSEGDVINNLQDVRMGRAYGSMSMTLLHVRQRTWSLLMRPGKTYLIKYLGVVLR